MCTIESSIFTLFPFTVTHMSRSFPTISHTFMCSITLCTLAPPSKPATNTIFSTREPGVTKAVCGDLRSGVKLTSMREIACCVSPTGTSTRPEAFPLPKDRQPSVSCPSQPLMSKQSISSWSKPEGLRVHNFLLCLFVRTLSSPCPKEMSRLFQDLSVHKTVSRFQHGAPPYHRARIQNCQEIPIQTRTSPQRQECKGTSLSTQLLLRLPRAGPTCCRGTHTLMLPVSPEES